MAVYRSVYLQGVETVKQSGLWSGLGKLWAHDYYMYVFSQVDEPGIHEIWIFKWNLNMKININESPNKRDLNQCVLTLWSKFGDPILIRWGVMVQAQNRVNLDFLNKIWPWRSISPQNNRNLKQGILHLWLKFSDPSLRGVRSYGADKLRVDAHASNTRRPKLAFGNKMRGRCIVCKKGCFQVCVLLPRMHVLHTLERERERLSLSAFLRTEDIVVHIVHISRLIITYTLE